MDTIDTLIRHATAHLEDLNYAEGTIIRYKTCWNQFKKYADFKNVDHFSLEFGYQFLTEHYGIKYVINA